MKKNIMAWQKINGCQQNMKKKNKKKKPNNKQTDSLIFAAVKGKCGLQK